MNITELPDTVTIMILEYLSYDEIARKREVCRRFNHIGQQVLNTGFKKVIREHGRNFKRIKALLPRRESERRNHCLSRHADILTSIETRISMLSMTYSKYIDLNMCCFIPGRVLDEIHRILRLISASTKQLRPHEVLQELRDISSMAIEHFDENIAVQFKIDKMAKMAEQQHCASSIGEISFSGVVATDSAARWSAVMSAAARSSTGMSANTRCCESMIQRVSKLLALGMNPNRPRPPPIDLSQQTAPQAAAISSQADIRIRNEVKNLKIKYDKGIFKMRQMHHLQLQQNRRLRNAHTAIAELSTQVSELKKQLEDVVANNCKVPASIEISTDELDTMEKSTSTRSDASVSKKRLPQDKSLHNVCEPVTKKAKV